MKITFNKKILHYAFVAGTVFLSGVGASVQAKDLDVLYIRGEFSDKRMTVNDQTWRNRLVTLNTTLDRYWKKHSYKKISRIKGAYTKELTFPGSSDDYKDVQKLRSVARDLASKAGFNLRDYDHVVYSYPSISHSINFGALGSPGNIWLPGANPFDGGLIHEFGHALGVGHAHSIEGAAGVVYPGAVRGGRDGLFMLGSDGNGRIGDYSTINLPMRYQMGFIDSKYIATAKTDDVHRIWEFELDALPSVRKLGVRVNVNKEDFWVSFAPTMVKRWANFNSAGFAKGVLVHRKNNAVTATLDFTPGSFNGTKNEEDFKDTRDGALQVGSNYKFPNSNVSIRPLRTGTSGGIRYIDVEIKTGVAPPASKVDIPKDYTSLQFKHSGKCLDVNGSSANNATNIYQWSCHNGNNQKFKFIERGNGYYNIVAKHSNSCVVINGSSSSNGANVHQWACSIGANRVFKLVDAGNNYFRIEAKHSGKCIDVSGHSRGNGANVHHWQCHGKNNQLFRFR